jgi:hypothetical protein
VAQLAVAGLRLLSNRDVTFTEPRTWLAPKGTKVPPLDLPLDGDWNRDITDLTNRWFVYDAYVNGVTRTYNNPKEDFNTSDLGTILRRPNGQDSVALASQTRRPSQRFLKWMNGLASAAKAATTAVFTYTVSGTPSGNGNIIVTLGGVAYTVPINSTTETTAALVAAELGSAANYSPALTGWTVGAVGTLVTFTAAAVGAQTPTTVNVAGVPGLTAGTLAAPTRGHGNIEAYWLDPFEDNDFMVGLEGWAVPGDDPDAPAKLMRWVGFNVSQSGNVANRDDWSGNDGNIQPPMALECQPISIPDEQLAGTGITRTILDPKGRETMWVIEDEA